LRQAAALDRVGRTLFRFRTLIGVAGFLLVYLSARPSRHSLLAGAAVIAPGLALRVWAAGHLGRVGRTQNIQASKLVTSGPYQYVRNPLYVANFLLVAGSLAALQAPLWLVMVGVAAFIVEYWLVARSEAGALETRFGETYRSYRHRVPAIIPRFAADRQQLGGMDARRFSWGRAAGELNTLAALAAVYFLALLRIRAGSAVLHW
jgi:protein-S-isoprenylcysteine O-methyltransferase Ste14